MQHLARKFEAEITFDFGSMIGTMENPRPTPLSLLQEMTADGHSFAANLYRFPIARFEASGGSRNAAAVSSCASPITT